MAQRHPLHRERGSALLVALMLMALTAMIATAIAYRQEIVIQETTQALTTEQQYLDAQSIVDLAKAKLLQNANEFLQDKKDPQAPIDTFPMTFDQTINGVEISGEIIDAQAFFNINSLRDQNAQAAFQRLISLVDPDIDTKTAKNITESIRKWISTEEQLKSDAENAQPTTEVGTGIASTSLLNNNSSSQNDLTSNSIGDNSSDANSGDAGNSPSGSSNSSGSSPATPVQNNDAVYLKKTPPYHPYHQLMANASELRMVDGVTIKLYDLLIPYLIALPSPSLAVNVNTAPAMVLAATAQNFSPSMAEMVVDDRQDHTFDSLTAYEADSDLINVTVDSTILTVQTNYFIVKATIKSGNQTLTVYTLLQRTMGNAANGQSGGGTGTPTSQNSASPTQSSSSNQDSQGNSLTTPLQSSDSEINAPSQQSKPKIQVLWQSIGSY